MKVYRIKADIVSNLDNISTYEIDVKSPWHNVRFYRGEIKNNYILPIKYLVEKKKNISDMPYSSYSMLASSSLLQALLSCSSHIQYLSSSIYYKEELLTDTYFTIIFKSDYPAISWEGSICKRTDDKARYIRKLSLSKNKIENIPLKEKIFKLSEATDRILVREDGKRIIEDMGITGITFEKLEVC